MTGDLLLSFLILVALLIGAIYLIRVWSKKLNTPSDRRKEIERTLKVDKIESLYEKGTITEEEFQKIRKVIAQKLSSIEEEEKKKEEASKQQKENSSEKKNNKG